MIALFSEALLVMLAVAAVDPDAEPVVEERSAAIPVAFARRPLIQPHHTYEIFVEAPVRNVDPRDPTLGLTAGARHGFSASFELGIVLLPLVFYRGVESAEPSLFGTYRLVGGSFELGTSFLVAFPIGGGKWRFEGSIPMLLHAADWLRLDFGVGASLSADTDFSKRVFAPLRVTTQLAPMFRIGATGGAEIASSTRRAFAFRVPVGGELFFTIRGTLGAAVDLGATFTFPALFDSSAAPRLSADRWIVAAVARFYEKAEINPLDE